MDIKQGDTVMVVGTGNIGLIMIQLLKYSGAVNIIAVEPVYLKQGEFCYFKSKTGIIYRIENVKGKYQVFNEKSTETQKATKEIMEKIVLVEKPKKNC